MAEIVLIGNALENNNEKSLAMNRVVPNLVLVGFLMVLCGIGGVVYFLAFFDASVATPQIAREVLGVERVSNLGLMQDRQLGLIVSVAVAITGAILLAVHALRPKPAALRPVDHPSRAIAPSKEDLQILLMQRKKNPPRPGARI